MWRNARFAGFYSTRSANARTRTRVLQLIRALDMRIIGAATGQFLRRPACAPGRRYQSAGRRYQSARRPRG